MKPRYLSLQERTAYRRLEDVVGCKWSAAVLAAIARGVTRPGQLERFIPGISTKVLNERLRKLLDYGLITRTEKPGRILQVHYHLTPTGQKLSAILDQLRESWTRNMRGNRRWLRRRVPPLACTLGMTARQRPGRELASGVALDRALLGS